MEKVPPATHIRRCNLRCRILGPRCNILGSKHLLHQLSAGIDRVVKRDLVALRTAAIERLLEHILLYRPVVFESVHAVFHCLALKEPHVHISIEYARIVAQVDTRLATPIRINDIGVHIEHLARQTVILVRVIVPAVHHGLILPDEAGRLIITLDSVPVAERETLSKPLYVPLVVVLRATHISQVRSMSEHLTLVRTLAVRFDELSHLSVHFCLRHMLDRWYIFFI